MKHLTLYNPHYQSLLTGFVDYLKTRGYSRSTCQNLPAHIREFLHYLESHQIQALGEVQNPDIETFIAYLQDRRGIRQGGALSAAYLNKYIQALKNFGSYLQEVHQISLSFSMQHFKQSPYAPTDILSPAEITALYAACGLDALGQRDRAMLSLYYGCGLRREEGQRLNLSDFQPERKLLYIRPGKNARDRYIPLTSQISQDLQNYCQQGRKYLLTRDHSEALLVCPPGRRVSGQSLNLRLKKLLLKASIGKDLGLHSLRHSIASHLWQAGMSLPQVARFLGHQSLESTQIYTRIIEN